MSNIVFDHAEEYILGILPEEKGLLKSMRDYAQYKHIPIIEREVAEFLKFLLALKKPRKILELGTAIGYSALVMASVLPTSQIDTVELFAEKAALARKMIDKAQLGQTIKVHEADALDFLKASQETYDFIFIDAAKGHYEEYIKEALRLLNRDGFILCDNILFHGMVSSDHLVVRRKKTIVKRMRDMLPKLLHSKSLQASILPLADGLLLIRRKDD
ncbi:MAG: O-methyltransferase [Tissierellia bacterium]|nr:O-methyltransferase [Tissierellia bacterium]